MNPGYATKCSHPQHLTITLFTTMTDLTRVWITGLQRRFTMVTLSRKSANGWETTLSGVPKWY